MNYETPKSVQRLSAAKLAAPESLAAATPMMEQFIEIKLANPDCLLFYRMGDFYELFFEDAETASRALGITLTKRGKHLGSDIPMCGVPVHAADDYLQKLIALGHRVAVCEQTEDPAEARKRGSKSVVRRDVVRLVTPGTITEEKLLAPGESNYLMAIGMTRATGGSQFALAWTDLSTGSFKVSGSEPGRLSADILRVDPRELILPDALFHDPHFKTLAAAIGKVSSPQPGSTFDSSMAEKRIRDHFGVAALDGFGEFSREELSAISGIIAYLEKTQKAERPKLERPKRLDETGVLFIDPATRASLELTRTLSGKREGSLLWAIDRTVTGAGARLLAERIAAPLTQPAAISERLDSISFALSQPQLGEDICHKLKRVPDMARALSRLALQRGGPRDLGVISAGLEAAQDILQALQPFDLPIELSTAIDAMKRLPRDFAYKLEEALSDELPLLRRDGGFVRQGYELELDEMRALRDKSRRVIAQMQTDLAEETGIRSLKIRHNNLLGYYIEVTTNHQQAMTGTAEVKSRFIHRQTMANAMRFTTTELAELESKIANAAGRALEIEQQVFDRLVVETIQHADIIRECVHALAAIDVAFALATLATSENWCRPEVDASLDFIVEAGRHPVVEMSLNREGGGPFVANDCDLSPLQGECHGAIWLITGPNMGGKSTFLRQNALIAVLAQAGSFVPAKRAKIGFTDRLFSRVGASDDLARGRSTFMVEMVETAAILNQASDRSLVILDEIGRGTATFDGLSIAWGTVEYLHEINHCRTMFATHFHEMTALSKKLDRLVNVTMRVKEWDGDVIFLHEVTPGAADRSYGIQVARLAGLPAEVIERARDVLHQLEEGEIAGKTTKLVDDLPLFRVKIRQDEKSEKERNALEQAVRALVPDNLTPKEALEAIYRLKGLI